MKYNHVMRTSCLAALICLSLSAVSLANGPVTDSAKASDPAFSVPVVSNPIPNEAIKDLEIVEDQGRWLVSDKALEQYGIREADHAKGTYWFRLPKARNGSTAWQNENVQLTLSGRAVSGGRTINIRHVRRPLGMVFQYSALFDSMTVGENVAFGLRQHTKDDEATIQRIVKEKLRLVGLEGIEDMMPNDLSGGMKKRVSLARAIALDPQVILYDEPTAGLDPLRCMDINRLVVSMQKQIHATSVIVTHDMDSAFYVADRLAYLQDGRFRLIADKKTFAHTQDEEVQRFIHGGRLPEERGDSL